jgi:hypothetical protein
MRGFVGHSIGGIPGAIAGMISKPLTNYISSHVGGADWYNALATAADRVRLGNPVLPTAAATAEEQRRYDPPLKGMGMP